jgi:acyl carrier protein
LDVLKNELRKLLIEIASLPPDFNENANLYDELGLSSMKAMEFLMALEDRYGVQVPDAEFVEATSLGQLTKMMQALKG